jgi:Xaa-Pro aminopeptidase
MMKTLITMLMISIGWAGLLPAQEVELVSTDMFAEHRAEFMKKMEGGIAIFTGQPEIPRNDDAGYPYRQDSDFYYLTGFEEPGSAAILAPNATDGVQFILFVRPRDPLRETWDGHRAGVVGAVEQYGADVAYPIDSLPAVLSRYLSDATRVFFDFSNDHPWAQTTTAATLHEWALTNSTEIMPTAGILDEMRLIKSPAEVALLERAIGITADAHRAAMAAIRPGMYEYEVKALIEYVFKVSGSPRLGFGSIVGAGPNSTILHYVGGDRKLEADDMVVIDIGAEWRYYTADVTRTVPVDGHFDVEQATIYQIVLDAQTAAMSVIRPGTSVAEIDRRAVEVVTAGLVDAGLLEGTVEENIESKAYRRFFMHGPGHWLGLDVHDVGAYIVSTESDSVQPRTFEPGMVLTIEPGVYIAEGSEGVDPKWWNIGVRIEDDVVVTEDGYEILSAGAPREIADIEALMSGRGIPSVIPDAVGGGSH